MRDKFDNVFYYCLPRKGRNFLRLGDHLQTCTRYAIWVFFPIKETIVPDRNGRDKQADPQYGAGGFGKGRPGHKHKTLR